MAVLGASGGGGGTISDFPITFASSVTWACPVEMEAYVFVIGPGGAGAGTEINANTRVQGGTAGGCAVSKLSLKAQNYAIVIGSGGATADPGGTSNGNNGSAATTFTDNVGTIATMTGNYGLGGNGVASGATCAAKAGGTATGGTLMNNTGGGVPAITTDARLTGGGAVGLWGPGTDGAISTGGLWYDGKPGYHYGPSAGTYGPDYGGTSSTMAWFAPPFNLQTTHQIANPRPNSSTDSQRARTNLAAGSMWNAQGMNQTNYSYTTTGTPLQGSGGYQSNYQYVYGGGCSLGGGGGGNINTHASAVMSTSGGGHGGVIIIPISMGS